MVAAAATHGLATAHTAHALLPVQVDIIVSEWMGYYLLRESMFDSVRSSVHGRLQLCLEACSSVY